MPSEVRTAVMTEGAVQVAMYVSPRAVSTTMAEALTVGDGRSCHGCDAEQYGASSMHVSHAAPPHPSRQLQTPGARQTPRWLHA